MTVKRLTPRNRPAFEDAELVNETQETTEVQETQVEQAEAAQEQVAATEEKVAAPAEENAPAQAEKPEPAADATVEVDVEYTDPPADEAPSTQAKVLMARTASSTALAVKKKVANPLAPLEWGIDAETLENMGHGSLPKITPKGTSLFLDRETDLGRWVDIEVQSYNKRIQVTPGDDSDEASMLLRTSYDGITLVNHDVEGETVQEYVERLKSMGYDEADARTYVDVWAILMGSEDDPVREDVEVVQVQLSPQSVKQWTGFMVKLGLLNRRGNTNVNVEEHPPVVRLKAQSKKNGNNDYSILNFELRQGKDIAAYYPDMAE